MTTPPNAQEPQAILVLREIAGDKKAGPIMSRLMADIFAAYDALKAERDATVQALQHVRQQAAGWKQEARTQKNTVDEVGAVLGGVPDYGPIVASVTALVAERDRLAAVVEKARAWDACWGLAYHMREKQDAEEALHDAVRELDAGAHP